MRGRAKDWLSQLLARLLRATFPERYNTNSRKGILLVAVPLSAVYEARSSNAVFVAFFDILRATLTRQLR